MIHSQRAYHCYEQQPLPMGFLGLTVLLSVGVGHMYNKEQDYRESPAVQSADGQISTREYFHTVHCGLRKRPEWPEHICFMWRS